MNYYRKTTMNALRCSESWALLVVLIALSVTNAEARVQPERVADSVQTDSLGLIPGARVRVVQNCGLLGRTPSSCGRFEGVLVGMDEDFVVLVVKGSEREIVFALDDLWRVYVFRQIDLERTGPVEDITTAKAIPVQMALGALGELASYGLAWAIAQQNFDKKNPILLWGALLGNSAGIYLGGRLFFPGQGSYLAALSGSAAGLVLGMTLSNAIPAGDDAHDRTNVFFWSVTTGMFLGSLAGFQMSARTHRWHRVSLDPFRIEVGPNPNGGFSVGLRLRL